MLMDEIYRYMPEEWRERMTDLPDNAKRDINNINTELVKRLHSKDTAFSLGKYSRTKKLVKNFLSSLSYFPLACKVADPWSHVASHGFCAHLTS